MKKKIGLVLFILFIFTSLATAVDDEIFSDTGQPESVEELSSKIESTLPDISHEDAAELAEAIQLIRELEREIFLTNQLIGLREEEEAIIPEVEELAEEPPPAEIIVAKQVSEEPEESLPREEKSIITELEKEEKVRKKYTPAAAKPISREKIQVYSKKELEKTKSSVIIEKEQTILISAVGLKRFIVTEPGIIKAVKEEIDKISVTGTSLGKSFIHIWDSEGRRTIRITVIQKGYDIFIKAQRKAIEAQKMESFKVRYSFDRYRLNSKSKNPDRSYHFTEWFHRLGITGATPWGRASSRFQYEGKEEGRGTELRRDLTAWDFNLRGEDIELSIGDTGAYFSDITLSPTSFQGARFRNPDDKKINYDILWGVRGNRMWGYRVLEWETANYFWGARGQVEPADFIHFNTTYMRSLEYADESAEYLYAGGMGLNFFDDALEIEGEASRSKSYLTDMHDHAYKIDTTLRLEDYNLLLEGTYLDIGPSFLMVNATNPPEAGKRGYYFDANYKPLKYFKLTGEYNVFRNRLSFNPTETQRLNYDFGTTVNFNIGTDTKFRYAFWNKLREGESTPTRTFGESYQISHLLSLPKPMGHTNLYLRYMPTQYKNLSSNTGNYRERQYAAGMRLNVLKNLYYDIEHSWQYRRLLESGESGTVKRLSTGVLYSTQFFETPFYGSVNFRYLKERDVMDNIPLTAAESFISGEAEIKYKPSGDFEIYLRANRKRFKGVLDHGQNRRETRIYGGGSYLLDTTLRWGIGGSVRGFVFRDTNGNGLKDLDEEGISGINVYGGEYLSTITDAGGKFEFRRIKELELSVLVDTKMLPEGYKPSTPNPQLIQLERDLVSEVYFGVMAVAEISGMVFNDVNMNGVFDGADEPARGVLLVLDDGTMAQTGVSGHYRMEDVRAGTVTLTLDTVSLPPNLIPLTKAKRTVEAVEGRYYEEDFSLYALRTIVGTVFIDKNSNKRFDAGEEGVAEVEVRVGDTVTLTDDMGRFFLKKLKGGVNTIEIAAESIPEGYEIVGDDFKEITLPPEGEIKEDVNFPLRKKQQRVIKIPRKLLRIASSG